MPRITCAVVEFDSTDSLKQPPGVQGQQQSMAAIHLMSWTLHRLLLLVIGSLLLLETLLLFGTSLYDYAELHVLLRSCVDLGDLVRLGGRRLWHGVVGGWRYHQPKLTSAFGLGVHLAAYFG